MRKDYRSQGIGKALIQKAIEWAKENRMSGIMLEAQDSNLTDCRFYLHFSIKKGAVDTMQYTNTENKNEKAVFMYYIF